MHLTTKCVFGHTCFTGVVGSSSSRVGETLLPEIDTTLLHRLAATTEVAASNLKAVLSAVAKHHPDNHPVVLVPVPDRNGDTPLDLALKAGNHAKAKLLAEVHARSAKNGAWRAASTALARARSSGCVSNSQTWWYFC